MYAVRRLPENVTRNHTYLLEARELGVIPGEVPIRFLYYVSDLPLEHRNSLSVRLHPSIGIPPLYAITREILTSILS